MSDKIKVIIRLRPLIQREITAGLEKKWEVKNKQIYLKSDSSKVYNFDKVFDESASTEEVYKNVAAPIISSVMQGFNGTIFAYGQTASGKTYTMMGDEACPGIIPLAVQDIFAIIENDINRQFIIRASYLEIYKENVIDLFGQGSKTKYLDVREDNGQVFVSGLKEIHVTNPDQIIDLMNTGNAKRHVGETNMNERSSRSHTIFRMIIEAKALESDDMDPDDRPVTVAHLNLVDLAGSEKAGQTGATGQRLAEGGYINKSLFILGQVISQLSEGAERFISYRDSKLTRILQNALGGNSRTVIISNITPAVVEETHSTLRFSTSAKRILNKPEKNEILSDEALIKRCKLEIMKLKEQLSKKEAHHEFDQCVQTLEEKEKLLKQELSALKRFICVSSQVHVVDTDKQAVAKRNRRQTWCPGKSGQPMLMLDNGCSINQSTFAAAPASRKHNLSLITEEKSYNKTDGEFASQFNNSFGEAIDLFPSTEEKFVQTDLTLEKQFHDILKQKDHQIEELMKQLSQMASKEAVSVVDNHTTMELDAQHEKPTEQQEPLMNITVRDKSGKRSPLNLSAESCPLYDISELDIDNSNLSMNTIEDGPDDDERPHSVSCDEDKTSAKTVSSNTQDETTKLIEDLRRENIQLRLKSELIEKELLRSKSCIEKLTLERDELQYEFNDLQEFTQLEKDLKNASILEKQENTNGSVCDVFKSPSVGGHQLVSTREDTKQVQALQKELEKILNEKDDLEALLEMDQQKFKLREKELCEALEAAHKELQSADSTSSKASENITEISQTDVTEDSTSVLRTKIEHLTAQIESLQEENAQLNADHDIDVDVLIETQSDIREKIDLINDLKVQIKDKELVIEELKQTKVMTLLDKDVQCDGLSEQVDIEKVKSDPSLNKSIQCDDLNDNLAQETAVVQSLNKSVQCDNFKEELNNHLEQQVGILQLLNKSVQCDSLIEQFPAVLDKQMRDEDICSTELNEKYKTLLAQSVQAKEKLLAEENHDMALKRRIKELDQTRKEITETFSTINKENQTQIDKLNREVLELRSQLAKAQAAEGLANGRLKKAEETSKLLKQELNQLEETQTKHILPGGHKDHDPDKMIDRINKMTVCLGLTTQRCEQYEAKIKELEVTASKAEDAMFARECLQQHLNHLEQMMTEKEQEILAVKQRYSSSFAEIEQLKSHSLSLEEELDQKITIIMKLEEKLKEAEERLSVVEEIKEVEVKLTEELNPELSSTEQFEAIRETAEVLKKENNSLAEQLAELQDELDRVNEHVNLVENQKENLIISLEKKSILIRSLEAKLKEAEERLSVVEEIKEVEVKLTEELNPELSSTEQFEAIRETAEVLKKENNSLDEQLAELQDELDRVNEHVNLVENQKENLIISLEKKSAIIVSLEEKLKEAEERLSVLERSREEDTQTIKGLKVKLDQLEAIRETAELLQKENKSLGVQSAELREEIYRLKEQVELIENQKENLIISLEKKSVTIMNLEEEFKQKEEKLCLAALEIQKYEKLNDELGCLGEIRENAKKLQEENNFLHQEYQILKEHIDLIENEKQNLEQSRVQDKSNEKLDEIIAENENLKKERANLMEQLDDKTRCCEELTQFEEALLCEKNLTKKEMEQLTEHINEIEQEKELLVEQLLSLEDLQREKHQLLSKLSQLEDDKSELLMETDHLKEDLVTVSKERESLKIEKQELTKQLVERNVKYEEMCCSLEKLTIERNNLQNKADEGISKIESMKSEIKEKEKQISEMLTGLLEMEVKYQDLQTTNKNNAAGKDDRQLEDEVQSDLKSKVDSNINDMIDQFSSLKKNYSELVDEKERIRSELLDACKSCDELEERNRVLVEKYEKISLEKNELQNKIEELTKKCKESEGYTLEEFNEKEKIRCELLDALDEVDVIEEERRVLKEYYQRLSDDKDKQIDKLLEKISELESKEKQQSEEICNLKQQAEVLASQNNDQKLQDVIKDLKERNLKNMLRISHLQTQHTLKIHQLQEEIKSLNDAVIYLEEQIKYYRKRVAELENRPREVQVNSQSETRNSVDEGSRIVRDKCGIVDKLAYYTLQSKHAELEKEVEKLKDSLKNYIQRSKRLEDTLQKYKSICKCSVRNLESDVC